MCVYVCVLLLFCVALLRVCFMLLVVVVYVFENRVCGCVACFVDRSCCLCVFDYLLFLVLNMCWGVFLLLRVCWVLLLVV